MPLLPHGVVAEETGEPQAFPIPTEDPTRPAARNAPASLPADGRLAAIDQSDPARNGFRYRLGPGDRLRMSVFKIEGYQAVVEVLSDGTINLPRLGSVPVWGLTLDEARTRISQGR